MVTATSLGERQSSSLLLVCQAENPHIFQSAFVEEKSQTSPEDCWKTQRTVFTYKFYSNTKLGRSGSLKADYEVMFRSFSHYSFPGFGACGINATLICLLRVYDDIPVISKLFHNQQYEKEKKLYNDKKFMFS